MSVLHLIFHSEADTQVGYSQYELAWRIAPFPLMARHIVKHAFEAKEQITNKVIDKTREAGVLYVVKVRVQASWWLISPFYEVSTTDFLISLINHLFFAKIRD